MWVPKPSLGVLSMLIGALLVVVGCGADATGGDLGATDGLIIEGTVWIDGGGSMVVEADGATSVLIWPDSFQVESEGVRDCRGALFVEDGGGVRLIGGLVTGDAEPPVGTFRVDGVIEPAIEDC